MHYINKKIANEVSRVSQRIRQSKKLQPKKLNLKLRYVNERIPISVPSEFIVRLY